MFSGLWDTGIAGLRTCIVPRSGKPGSDQWVAGSGQHWERRAPYLHLLLAGNKQSSCAADCKTGIPACPACCVVAEPGSPERLLGRMADPIDRIDLIEVAKQPRLMRTFALQFGYAHPYVMEGERPREPRWVMCG